MCDGTVDALKECKMIEKIRIFDKKNLAYEKIVWYNNTRIG